LFVPSLSGLAAGLEEQVLQKEALFARKLTDLGLQQLFWETAMVLHACAAAEQLVN
jgi:hypothetical protein